MRQDATAKHIHHRVLRRGCRWLAGITGALIVGGAWALPPDAISIQGRLVDDSGLPLSGLVPVDLVIYRGGDLLGGGTEVYRELATVAPDSTGIFTHALGDGVPSSGSQPFDRCELQRSGFIVQGRSDQTHQARTEQPDRSRYGDGVHFHLTLGKDINDIALRH